jgi:hypothetical protein
MNNPVNERKSGKKRVMVQIWGRLAKAIDQNFREMHIKRDGYLNDLLTREIEELATEVTFRNSDDVRKRFRERPIPDRVKLNLDLDETLVKRMDEVLSEKNIPRDSFINRVLFFLVAKDVHLDYMNIEYDKKLDVTAKPLSDAKGFLLDPFFHIRSKNEGNFYTLHGFPDGPFGGDKGPNLFGLNIAFSDEAWRIINTELEDLFPDLFGETSNKEANHVTN